ncbi:ATP-binding cassette, subfamily B, bacterial MsbA [Bathymodiolus platifrons methanotrophic gill symbiont]|uniref:lipid A export permease/ATP-binding protein MsbA n=1 Tax=Bathymodiolus platifrons methanotrophic gill symbiont TaxID=113268 RepID=UPI000B41177D|nr:lipid A export permease/ATP-binding protein MsbA [Bathymodiolus platifrons methanotrophic gill symbiont]MCK5870628.1 lipid A export permease/ATP-binding protein MsbA [Methyloprofundus sp.]TXL13957.1 lipid A export permease/ATP-binding protein MsbA [Methylococcaceae bacterium HT4]TXL19235.1 lipid A export permease/ATP-binding protein MsbA [Methylococcaceae bacterium HT5]GAW85922.1 ATP-binding cassette, subfamily B, bacterial MsbA [Bathymodiolus platifrons methanotrophic gill symbiont]GFO7578
MSKKNSSFSTYKRLLKYVIPNIRFFIISIFGFIIVAIAQPLFAELVKLIIDTIEHGNKADKTYLPAYIIGIVTFRSIGTFFGNYYLAKVSVNVVHRLRQEIFNHYTQLSIEYFDAQNSGHLISLITYNVAEVTRAVTESVKTFVREGLTAIGLISYLLWLNWKLTLVFFIIAPFIAILVSTVSKKLRSLSKNVQDSMGNMTHITSELVTGNRVVKCFGGAAYEVKRFKQSSLFNKQQSQKVALVSAIQNPIIQLLTAFALSGLLFLALTMMGNTSTGGFVAYLLAAFMIPRPIQKLTSANNDIQKGIAAASDIFNALDVVPELDQGTVQKANGQGVLQFENISFSYANSDKPALKNINISIKSGETVAIVGASGSGKTTLTNLIPRFYDYSEGRILLDGVEINQYTLSCLREQIALVTQNISLFNDTVFNNIAYGILGDIDEADVLKAADDAYATEFIENLTYGMQTEIGEQGIQLSGGQRQRLAIARALLKNAPLLILDEATSALDTQSERYIQKALAHVMAHRTTIVIAHRLSTIENADVILVMEAGEIVERGTHIELLAKNGAYSKLHALQFNENHSN